VQSQTVAAGTQNLLGGGVEPLAAEVAVQHPDGKG